MKSILLLVFVMLFTACKKNEHCETWLIQDMCYPKRSGVSCGTFPERESEICGARLDDANQGRETIRQDGPDAKLTTRYIKKIR